MEIIYKAGRFYATDVVDPIAMQAAGWRWDKMKMAWIVADREKAAPFAEYAIGDAKTRIDAFIQARHDAVKDSFALDADIDVPVPDGCTIRPYQAAGVAYMVKRKNVLNADAPRLGKAQPLSSRIMTPTGWTTMGELRVGSELVSTDGCVSHVTGIYPQGTISAYSVVFSDGTAVECSEDHLWSVTSRAARVRSSKPNVRTLKELVRRGIKNKHGRAKWAVPVLPVRGDHRDLPLAPYVVGYLLGNGALTSSSPALSCPDADWEWLRGHLSTLLPHDVQLSARHTSEHGVQVCMVTALHKNNVILDALRALDMCHGSRDKRIPSSYCMSSIPQRLELLRGLMDSDGSCTAGRSVFHSTNAGLAGDVLNLARSLGYVASIRSYRRDDKTTYSHDYQVTLRKGAECPFSLPRKARQWRPGVSTKLIVGVTYVGNKVQQCISVSAPDSLYMTDGYTWTHNTIQTICTANAAYPCPEGSAFQKLRILIVCPANAKINWHREWQKWNTLPHLTHGIISGSDNPQTDVLVINYDILSRHYDYLSSIVWDIVVFDEAHRLKNERSARTRYCIGDGSTAHPGLAFSRLRIFLTGTPIKTRPIDLWPILKACDPQGLGKNRWGFAERYCDAKKVNGVWDMSGASNMEELQRRLRQTFMIRREKHEVVKEVPSNRQTIILPQAGLTKLLASERDAIGALVDDFEAALLNLEGSLDRLSRLDGIVRDDDGGGSEALSTVRQELALAKLDMCFEHMDELLAAEDKIVVFAYHRAVVKKMYERFSETHGAVMVIGGLTETARQKAIDDFKTDPTRRVMVANLISAGEAIDLSVADVACFVEISWVPADLDQAEERIWAVTKERPVSIYKYVVEDSMDDIMLRVVEGRQKNIALAMNREYMAA